MRQPPRTRRPRLPAFHPVPVRERSGGWTARKQAEFIGKLAETGSVSAAAGFVGRSRETAYRLRRMLGGEDFAEAWDAALAFAGKRVARGVFPGVSGRGTPRTRKVTLGLTVEQVMDGTWRPVMRRGKYAWSVRKPSIPALLSRMARLDPLFRAKLKETRREAWAFAQMIDIV